MERIATATSTVDYDKVAPAYDLRYASTQYSGIAEALLRFVTASPQLRVLEVGCGTGHWLSVLAREGLPAIGLDASLGMLAQARANQVRTGIANGRAEQLPWRDRWFDRVACINAFHHFTDKAAFLAEARRVLRPGGGVMIVSLDPQLGMDRWAIYDYFPATLDNDRRRYPTGSAIRAQLEAAGFERCETALAERIELTLPALTALDNGLLDQRFTSQLTLLSVDDYRAGLDRIRADATQAEQRGESLELVTDVHLFATLAWLPR
ncbi:MAG TPA: class I SAM-dependent methyltransferase [Terriglobales bacterium]|nr:class I SAM-dependent methyltransferase [Terriglobales bacterium]